jgi:hypothetical protein
MAIGYPVTVSSVNSQAAGLALQWQQLAADMAQFAAVTGGLTLTALETLGFTSGDAALIANIAANMGIIATVYYGTAAAPTLQNYDFEFLLVRGTV